MLDFSLLGVEEEEEEKENKCIDMSPPMVEEIDDSSRSVESDTASSSRASTSDSEGQPQADLAIHWRGFFRLLTKGPGMRFQTFTPLKVVPKLTRRKSKRVRQEMVPAINSALDADFGYFKSTWKNFALSELLAATNDFSHG